MADTIYHYFIEVKSKLNTPMRRMYRVITVSLDVLRFSYGSGVCEFETVVPRKVRRVKTADGWKWQLVREFKDQELWDIYLGTDRESLNEINHIYGLLGS